MSPMTSALISYWHRLPSESPAIRRKALDAVRERVRVGIEPPAALVPFALGDVDDGIVAAATQAYVAAIAPAADAASDDPEAITEVTDWVRRGLALNRGAVFGALLARNDERLAERLAALRLVLSAVEVESACRVIGAAGDPRTAAFVENWLTLIADSPLQRERRLLSALLEAGRGAKAA
jgi:hypothetical protein